MLDTDLSILRDKSDESFLVGLPGLQDVHFFGLVEASAQEHPVAEFTRHTQRSADKSKLSKDCINLATILLNEGIEL